MGFSPSPHHLHQVLVDVFAVGDNEDAHNLVLVIDTVDDSVFTTGDTVPVLVTRAHLPATVRARVSLELFDGLANLLIIGRGTQTNLLQHLLEIVLCVMYSDLKHCFSLLRFFC